MDTSKTTGKQREKRVGGVTGKGFQPGVSGNPNGRPRTAKFSEAARGLLVEIDAKSGETNAEVLVRHCFKRALRGSVRHAELMLAYAEGRPKQGLEVSGEMDLRNLGEDQIDARIKVLLETFKQGKENAARRED